MYPQIVQHPGPIPAKAGIGLRFQHHQAVLDPGRHAIVNATAADTVIEGVEDPRYRFCLGVQWHPEYFIDPGDRRIFDALIAACQR